jgi:hypothetical protein
MAGEVDRRHIGTSGVATERDQAAPHLVKADVGDEGHRKTKRLSAAATSLASFAGLGSAGTFA